jgi:hypothetical protein
MQSFSSPSELIDVFLDGEHTGTERAVLFSALGANTDLQAEFEEALRIRTAALTDAALTMPPPELTGALMARAGFGASVAAGTAAGSALAPAASAGFLSSIVTSLASLFTILRIPLLTGVLGFFAGSMYSGSGTSVSSTEVPQRMSISARSVTPAISASPSSETESSGRSQSSAATNGEGSVNRTSVHADSESASPSLGFPESAQAKETVENNRGTTPSGLADGIEGPEANVDAGPRDGAQLQPPATSDDLRSIPYTVRSQSTTVTYAVPDFEVPQWRSDMVNSPSTSLLEVSIRGTRGLSQTLDSLVNRADAVNMGNVGVGLRYAVSPNLQVLLEGGRENFATYVYDNTAGTAPFRIQQNIVWAAAGVRGVVDVFADDLHTAIFGQLLVGASDVGALVRPMAGLQWKPDSRITLFGGVEQMVLQTRAQGTTGMGSKFSVTYGLSLSF